jgi:hypothetical protein
MAETSRVKRSEHWAGLKPGDAVDIDDARAKRGSFEFVALVEHPDSGSISVEVVGGRRGDRKLWSFRPEQIFLPGKRGKGPSVAEAPGLDLR